MARGRKEVVAGKREVQEADTVAGTKVGVMVRGMAAVRAEGAEEMVGLTVVEARMGAERELGETAERMAVEEAAAVLAVGVAARAGV